VGSLKLLAILCRVGAAASVVGCARWPVSILVDPATSGLIGDWAKPDETGPADSIVWRFRPDGIVERFQLHIPRAGAVLAWQRIQAVRWEVRRNRVGDPRRAVCLLSPGRPPRWPSCQLFTIDTLADPTGKPARRLTWEGWVGERRMTTQVFWERRL
jgi:hypothetical protein